MMIATKRMRATGLGSQATIIPHLPGDITSNPSDIMLPVGCSYEPYDPGGGSQLQVLKYRVVCDESYHIATKAENIKELIYEMSRDSLFGVPLPLLLVGGLLVVSTLLRGNSK